MYCADDSDTITALRANTHITNGLFYKAAKIAESTAERKRINDIICHIISDFGHAGTAASGYVGGGGYIKRAWDEAKRPLKRRTLHPPSSSVLSTVPAP
jgi:hypothetical protein